MKKKYIKLMMILSLLSLIDIKSVLAEEVGSWETICKQVATQKFPATDRPTETEKVALNNCDSELLYYGINVPIDYIKARKCAFIEMEMDDKGPFSGSALLMMIYANGQGVKKNLDLATKIACDNVGFFMTKGEEEGQINHLQQLKTKAEYKPYDICEHMETSNELAICAAREASIAKAKRDAKLAAIVAKWSPMQQKAFMELHQVAEQYFKMRQENEVDMTGTIRGVNFVAAGEEFDMDFNDAINDFEKEKLPIFSFEEFEKSDVALNKEYARIMQIKEQDWQTSGMGTLTKEGIKNTQRAWIRYRDAWVKFGAIRYPQVSADSWKTWLTQDRVANGFYWSIG